VLFVEGYFLFEQEIGSLFLWEEIKRSLFSLNTIRYKDYRTIRFVFFPFLATFRYLSRGN